MNINIGHSQTLSAQTATTGSGRAANVYHNSSQLTSVNAGEVLTGEISAINGRDIQITLGNDQVITARLTQEMTLSLGQMMSFQVKSNSGSQIALTPLLENMAQDSAAAKAIQAAGIPMNNTTMAMTSAMMEEGMPINRESLQSMFRIVNANEGANPASIVKMTSLALPINSDTIEQFEAYENHAHQIAGSVDEMALEFAKLSQTEGLGVTKELLDIFLGQGDENLTRQLMDNLNQMNQPVMEEVPDKPSQPQSFGDIMKELELAKTQSEVEEPIPEETVIPEPVEVESPLGNLIDGNGRIALAQMMKELGLSEAGMEQIISGTMMPEDVLRNLQSMLSMAGGNTEIADRLKELIQGEDFQKLLKDTVSKQWTLNPKEVENKENVAELYKKILSQADRTMQLMNQLGKGDSVLAKGAENLKQNVNFLNQLNQVFAYVQLPLKMNQRNAHGDLYVYSKKKNLTAEDGNVTALLHLEMEQLGTMDIHVALKNGNEVKTHFYLEKEEMLDFIEENIDKLDERLQKRGYHASCDASVRKPAAGGKDAIPDNLALDEMLGKKEAKHQVAKYSFDVRA